MIDVFGSGIIGNILSVPKQPCIKFGHTFKIIRRDGRKTNCTPMRRRINLTGNYLDQGDREPDNHEPDNHEPGNHEPGNHKGCPYHRPCARGGEGAVGWGGAIETPPPPGLGAREGALDPVVGGVIEGADLDADGAAVVAYEVG